MPSQHNNNDWKNDIPDAHVFVDPAAHSLQPAPSDKPNKNVHDHINDASHSFGNIVKDVFVYGSYVVGGLVLIAVGVYATLWLHRPVYTANDFQSPDGLNPAQAENLNEMIRVCNVQTGTPSVCRALYMHANVTAVYEREEYPPKERG